MQCDWWCHSAQHNRYRGAGAAGARADPAGLGGPRGLLRARQAALAGAPNISEHINIPTPSNVQNTFCNSYAVFLYYTFGKERSHKCL